MIRYSKLFFIFSLSISSIFNCSSQNKVELSTGAGLSQLLNIGIQYNFTEKFQSTIHAGILPLGGVQGNVTSFTGGFCYYYTGHSEFTNQPAWYLKTGVSYIRDDNESNLDKILLLNIQHGKVFNFSKRMGIRFEIGLGIGLSEKKFNKDPDVLAIREVDNRPPVLPTFGIDLFYRF